MLELNDLLATVMRGNFDCKTCCSISPDLLELVSSPSEVFCARQSDSLDGDTILTAQVKLACSIVKAHYCVLADQFFLDVYVLRFVIQMIVLYDCARLLSE